MKIINFGSINIDHVYGVDHFVRPGETLESGSYRIFSGGKGANQSFALARAGAAVMHAGKVGPEGAWLKEKLQENGVDVSLVKVVDAPTGHAIIQVNKEGENAIIIYGGANRTVSDADIEKVLEQAEAGDYLLLQNEINALERVLQKAKGKGVTVVFNPAPMTKSVKSYPLELVDIFIVNEIEGEALSAENDPEAILDAMLKRYPKSRTVLTRGKAGVIYADEKQRIEVAALKVKAVDTTGAGDTFIGYFLAELSRGSAIEKCLQRGVKASAICVTRKGAADSIPRLEELL
ncbi:ribokinase [Sulfurimonas sp. HSL3-7]|uniref:ribokinase n=1 Tax=Sulfonitrofixus jiaomeiensis TaxID=3131938 RepID=UPI0031F8B131